MQYLGRWCGGRTENQEIPLQQIQQNPGQNAPRRHYNYRGRWITPNSLGVVGSVSYIIIMVAKPKWPNDVCIAASGGLNENSQGDYGSCPDTECFFEYFSCFVAMVGGGSLVSGIFAKIIGHCCITPEPEDYDYI